MFMKTVVFCVSRNNIIYLYFKLVDIDSVMQKIAHSISCHWSLPIPPENIERESEQKSVKETVT